jgi:hypothetical protein
MAITTPTVTLAKAGIKIDRQITDYGTDFPLLPNDVIVHDTTTGEVFKKIDDRKIEAFTDTGIVEYIVSFVEIEQVLELIGVDTTIDSITESIGVDTLTVDINGGGFAAPSPPIALSVGDEVTWQISYTGGHDKASINIKATI